MSDLLVAKFGGTSMARPELVVPHLEQPGEIVDIAVVSAAGEDQYHPNKVTKMLLGYKINLFEAEEIQSRYQDILNQTNSNDKLSKSVVDQIPIDLKEWTAKGDPVEALGEIWSAKLFAIQTGRQFVDARELIHFHNDGTLNTGSTRTAIRARLGHGGRFVVNGFCGMRADGRVQVFPRGGSDITGAILAAALEVREYHNWSDVDGFMTADPKKVPDAQLLDLITYREARELGNGGSELLHRAVIPILGLTGIKTVMRKTFGELGNRGTEIVRERAWQWQPLVGVTGRDDLFYMAIHEFGLNEGVGTTLDVFEELKAAGIPYEHIADATDDVSNYLAIKYKKPVKSILDKIGHHGRSINLHDAGLVHVVGEGLAHSGINRFRVLGKVATALADHGIEGRGATDVAESATLTLFVNPKMVNDAIRIAHQALELEKAVA